MSRVAARDVTKVDAVALVVHYGAREDRAVADAVAEVLGVYDYRVIARLPATPSGPGEVRYFYPPDRTAAVHVQSIVANVLAGKGKPERVKLVPDSPRRTGAKLGRIDIRIPSANERRRARSSDGAVDRRRASARSARRSRGSR